MEGFTWWDDVRAEYVEKAGGEQAVAERVQKLLAELVGQRLAEIRRSRRFSRRQVADRMGIAESRVAEIERGKVAGPEIVADYAYALGGQLGSAIHFFDGEIAGIPGMPDQRG